MKNLVLIFILVTSAAIAQTDTAKADGKKMKFYNVKEQQQAIDSVKNFLPVYYDSPTDSLLEVQILVTLTRNRIALAYTDHTDYYQVKTKGRNLTKPVKFKFKKKNRGSYLELIADDRNKAVTKGKLHIKGKKDVQFYTLR